MLADLLDEVVRGGDGPRLLEVVPGAADVLQAYPAHRRHQVKELLGDGIRAPRHRERVFRDADAAPVLPVEVRAVRLDVARKERKALGKIAHRSREVRLGEVGLKVQQHRRRRREEHISRARLRRSGQHLHPKRPQLHQALLCRYWAVQREARVRADKARREPERRVVALKIRPRRVEGLLGPRGEVEGLGPGNVAQVGILNGSDRSLKLAALERGAQERHRIAHRFVGCFSHGHLDLLPRFYK